MLATFEARLARFQPTCSRLIATTSRINGKSQRFQPKPATVAPAKVKNAERWTKEKDEIRRFGESTRIFRREFKKEIDEHGDFYHEPDLSSLQDGYQEYSREMDRKKSIVKKRTMFRKHFRDLEPREVSLLTWAEKQNIRYLCETEPEQWSPESISKAYPISARGVEKLLKSTLRLQREKDVRLHDTKVAERIQALKAGKLPITEELEARLKIRDLIPLKIGDLGANSSEMISMKPDVSGEFASLVAPPPQMKKGPPPEQKDEAVKFISDGDMCVPYKQELPMHMSKEELRSVMSTGKLMTFRDFESRMKSNNADSLSADMKYMLHLKVQDGKSAVLENDEIELPSDVDVSFPSRVQKRKPTEECDMVAVNVEGNKAYVYRPETGYQKPYESSKIPDKILIPDELWKPGATYKYRDCYYDDEGEFLYRVV